MSNHSGASDSGGTAASQDSGSTFGALTECAELFEIRALLQRFGDQTTDHCQTLSGLVARQRGRAEAVSESLRRLDASLREARSQIDILGVALDRIKIVALNTGLEGARLGDLAGKALVAVSEELRTLTARGLELLSEQASTMERMEDDHQRITTAVDSSQGEFREFDGQLREVLACEKSRNDTLARFAEALQRSTGLDLETAERLGKVEAQARNLLAALENLARPEHRRAARSALLPALEPLLSWLAKGPEVAP